MPKFRLVATMDVEYTAIVEAKDEEHAWSIASDETGVSVNWYKTDDGHDWTLENVYKEE